jgi:hypothetical protein
MPFPHKIKPGIYKLPVAFKSAPGWIDKRLKGTGFRTSSGFSAGTVFVVRRAPWRDTEGGMGAVVLEAPFTSNREDIQGSLTNGGTHWWTDNGGVEKLLDLLVPDDSDESWVGEATGLSWSSSGCATDVLTLLLETGKLTRDDVQDALATIKARV